ncbi:hypothetical protein CaCOL14_012925 [Colletotrichum acutatum]
MADQGGEVPVQFPPVRFLASTKRALEARYVKTRVRGKLNMLLRSRLDHCVLYQGATARSD